MDVKDLFRQLTTGVKFAKKRKPELKKEKHIVSVKEEPDVLFSDDEDADEDLKEEKLEIPTKDDNSNDSEQEEAEFKLIEGGNIKEPAKKKKKTKLSPEQQEKIKQDEMIAALRKEHRITVLGKNIPPPIQAFEDLHAEYKVTQRLIKNIVLCSYTQPTAIQMQAMPIMLQGRPLMACAPTGSGKTIAFLTPILNDLGGPKTEGFRAIILAPTRELAQQIYRECVRLSEKTFLKIHIISNINKAKQKFGPNGSKKCDILISTPNRIRYLIQQEPPLLDLSSIEWFIIDEADRLMEEGTDNFKEQLDDILKACANPNKKIALFSATYTVPVAKWALKNLKNLARVTVGQQNSATESVEQQLLFVGAENGKLMAIRDLVRNGLKPPVLIFVQSKDRAKQLFEELLYDGINVDAIHADRTQQQRDNSVRAFREGRTWFLICTELMGRGIDFKGVNLVINYDFPPSTIAYIHRIGRTGRAGRPGKAITFFTQDDTPNLRSIAHVIKSSGGKVPEFMLQMKKPRKSEKKRLEKIAPKRDDISTKLRPEKERQDKLNRLEAVMKKHHQKTQDSSETGDKSKKLKKINKIKNSYSNSNGNANVKKSKKMKTKNKKLK